jgi:hypothetical protein
MAFRVEEDGTHRIVRVFVEGEYDRGEIEQLVGEGRAASARTSWNILCDMRAARPGRMTPAEVFWLPRQHPSLRAPGASTVRVATVHKPEHAAIAAFWENAYTNAGLQARAFTDEAAAIAWLQEPA